VLFPAGLVTVMLKGNEAQKNTFYCDYERVAGHGGRMQ
jgi:hypothetical protein